MRRFTCHRRDQRGSATIEFILLLGALFFPLGMSLIAATSWPERMNAAHAAAYEAAKAVVTADDPVAGQDVGRSRALEVLANHGFATADVEVTYSLADPRRGDAVQATVTITLPALVFPGAGQWDAIRRSQSNTQRVGDYRGFS